VEVPEHESKSVIRELMHIVRQADDAIASEANIDADLETLDSVRYEQELVTWRSRISTQRQEVRLFLHHEKLEQISGRITQYSETVLLFETETHQYLVNNDSVEAILGLTDRAKVRISPTTDDFLMKIWLHDICDRQISATWFIGKGRSLHGYCVRTGSDSIDVRSGNECMVIALKHLVAVQVFLNRI